MKQINKFPVIIVAAIVVGFLLASATTKITHRCVPVDGAKGCASFSKAMVHPEDLLHNKQNSLVIFSTTFAEVSLFTFVILAAASLTLKKKT